MDKTKRRTQKPGSPLWAAGIRPTEYYDFSLVAVVIVLVCFGLIMLYSTTAYSGMISDGNDMQAFLHQAGIDVACFGAAIVISRVDLKRWRMMIVPFYFVSVAAMFLVQVSSFAVESHGAARWVKIGPLPQFQPSELSKIAVILILSEMVTRFGVQVERFASVVKLFAIGAFPALVAWKVTNNLSTGIIIMAITAGMIFIAHPKTLIFLLCLALAGLLVWFFIHSLVSARITSSDNFRLQRILTWLNPEEYIATGEGYQTMQGLYAVGSGGIFGRGFGNSIQKLGAIPEAQNDMIFAIVCEELGIFGVCIMLALFGYLLYRMEFIARHTPDNFDFMVTSGVFLHIALQVILNVSVVLNLIPNTGVTLPFISYGGTSMLFLMVEIGFVLNVSRRIRYQDMNQALL